MISILEAKRANLFARAHLMRNIVAGVIVGVVALPLAMAFAIASGARPEQGLYTAIIAGLLVSIFGGSRVQIAGPTGAFIVILADITAKFGIDGLQLATLMAGALLLLMGMMKLGSVIRYIPDPVIVGFTSGIGVIIFVGQWKDFFGLPAPSGTHFHEKLWDLLLHLPQLHVPTALLALFSLALLLIVPRVAWLRRAPAPLIALVAATVAQSLLQLPGVATIGSAFGGIPQGLPHFSLPQASFARVLELLGPAFTIAMLGAIESLLSAVVADGMAGTRHDSNQELIGQGLANLATPLFGGFAATGAIARTATNVRNGGNSPLAGIVHALTLVAVLLALAPLASAIPLAVLAAILFVVAYNMSEAHHFVSMLRRAPPADVVVLVITFLVTVFADLVVAVNIGVVLAVLHFLRRMAQAVSVQPLNEREIRMELSENGLPPLPHGIQIYEIDGPFFFAAVEHFEQALEQINDQPRVLIVRLRRVPFIDMTGLQALEESAHALHRRGVQLILCEANARVHGKLARAGILAMQAGHDDRAALVQAIEQAQALAAHVPAGA